MGGAGMEGVPAAGPHSANPVVARALNALPNPDREFGGRYDAAFRTALRSSLMDIERGIIGLSAETLRHSGAYNALEGDIRRIIRGLIDGLYGVTYSRMT